MGGQPGPWQELVQAVPGVTRAFLGERTLPSSSAAALGLKESLLSFHCRQPLFKSSFLVERGDQMLGDLILSVTRVLAVTLGMGKVPFPVLLWLCFSETLPSPGLNMLHFSQGLKCKKRKCTWERLGRGRKLAAFEKKGENVSKFSTRCFNTFFKCTLQLCHPYISCHASSTGP